MFPSLGGLVPLASLLSAHYALIGMVKMMDLKVKSCECCGKKFTYHNSIAPTYCSKCNEEEWKRSVAWADSALRTIYREMKEVLDIWRSLQTERPCSRH